MAKKKREVPEINSSSTADIAFLLLIFFLITTSMDTDRGLARRLPPPPEKDQKLDDAKKKERNVLQVFLNMQDQLMCGNDYITVDQLRAKAKEFIANPYNEDTKPEKISKNVPFFGTVQVTEGHVISLRCDRGSSYKAYMSVQNELVAAYNEFRYVDRVYGVGEYGCIIGIFLMITFIFGYLLSCSVTRKSILQFRRGEA